MARMLITLTAALVGLGFATAAGAESVSGTLNFGGGTTNYFDPANGFVPTGYGNSSSPNNVAITSGVEFGFNDGGNLDTADFSSSGLVLSDDAERAGLNSAFKETFTLSPALSGTLTLVNSSFAGLTYSISGDTLTVNVPGGTVTANEVETATFRASAVSAAPEPGAWALMLGGVGAMGLMFRRRRSAALTA